MSIQTAIAANRFGLGARPGELAAIGNDPRSWLVAQVQGPRPAPAAIQALPSSAAGVKAYAQVQQQRREMRESRRAVTGAQAPPAGDPPARADAQRQLLRMHLDQVLARYTLAVRTEEAFRERLVHFWTNHFAVSVDKQQVLALAGTLENEVIRPGVAGNFAAMLQAVVRHPAMILYLDNQGSVGPSSPLALRIARGKHSAARKADINENLAREILELHTLGVNGGYSQQDVTTLARVLTGWSVASAKDETAAKGDAGTFLFRPQAHEPGEAIVLGKRYAAAGEDQGKSVLDDLARHPATATHVAAKLVRHFVADAPPQAAVAKIARVFRDSDGDLPTVHRAVSELPQAWQPAAVKFKTPHEYVISTLRCLDFVPQKPAQIDGSLKALGQRAFAPRSPAGWPDIAAAWDGPDALFKRIEWTAQIGARFGVRKQPLELAQAALGETLSARTRTAIERAADASQGLSLLFASPDFLRR